MAPRGNKWFIKLKLFVREKIFLMMSIIKYQFIVASNSKGATYFQKQFQKWSYSIPFKVEINMITSRVGFTLEDNGWHPFIATLQEYEVNQNLKYEDSSLARLYQQFQPQNVQEILIDKEVEPIEPICNWPPYNHILKNIWKFDQDMLEENLQNDNVERWILFGPHTVEFGQMEFNRLIKVYESIKRNGYRTDLAVMDPINGYFLKDEDKIRFVLLQGNHRVSALKVLGYTKVICNLRNTHPPVIERDNLSKWTKEEGGLYSLELAEQMFDALFHSTGYEKATKYNLIKGR